MKNLFLAASFLILLSSCGGGGSSANPPAATLTSIAISPQNPPVAAGLTLNLTATGTFSDGSSRPLPAVSWSSSDATVATIDANGKAKALKQGAVTISGSTSGISGSTTVTVGPPVPTGITLSPTSATVYIGATAPKFSAMVQYTDGSTVNVSLSATWTVTNKFVADIDASGSTTVHRAGFARIQVAAQGYSTTGALAVLSIPRYMYSTSDAARIISRMTLESQSGKLRYAGYQPTNANNYATFGCLTTDPSNSFAYTGTAVNSPQASDPPGQVQIDTIDPDSGDLTALPGSPFPVTAPIGCIQFEPKGKFGYATASLNAANNQIVTFSRDAATGMLTMLASVPLAGPPSGLTMDPRGEFLYAATYSLGPATPALAYGFRIDSTTGALTPIQDTPFQLSFVAGSFSFDPAGAYVYMANTNGNSIDLYAIDRGSGKLSAQAGATVAPCINPSEVRFSPNAKFAYLTCTMNNQHSPNSASLVSFGVGENGQLTQLGSAPIADGPSALNVSPDGRFAYAIASGDANYYTYQIGADGVARTSQRSGSRGFGSLTIVGGATAVTYESRFAYVISKSDNSLTSYGVNANGMLTQMAIQATPPSPVSLSLLPWGSNLLMGSASSPAITPFLVDRSAGTLTQSGQFANPTTLGSALIDPSEKWAFVTDSSNGSITTYQRSGAFWGLLTYLPPSGPPYSSFPAGAGAGPMVVDPSGQFLYVANKTGNSISAYRYFGTSPQLLESTTQFTSPYGDGSPYSLPTAPIAVAMDPAGAFLFVVCADNSLRVFQVDYFSWGHLKLVTTVTFGSTPTGLTVLPTGSYIYVSSGMGVNAFAVNAATGGLTTVDIGSSGQLANATSIYAEPSGRYLYATTASSVYGFGVAADGTITPLPGGAVAVSNQSSSITFLTQIK